VRRGAGVTAVTDERRPTVSGVLFGLLAALTAAAGATQFALEMSPVNLWSTLLVVATTCATLGYLWATRAFVDTPVSALALLGLCVTTQWASLVAQSLSGRALVDGLRTPLMTFGLLAGVQGLALLTHWIYRRLQPTRESSRWLARRLVAPLGGFAVFPVQGVWALSLVGAASRWIGAAEFGDAGGKVFEALGVLAFMPVLIPILHARFGDSWCRLRTQVPLLLAYATLMVFIGMARNSRALMLIGPIQVLLVMLVYGLRDFRPATSHFLAGLLIAAAAAGVGLTAARDLVTAMVVVREHRTTLTPVQMITETIAALGERHKLDIWHDRALIAGEFDVYEETYLGNPVLARFSETKFHDNMLVILQQLDADQRREFAEMTWLRALTALPQPALDMLGIELQKEEYQFSMGDYYRTLSEGKGLGGFATGSIWVDFLTIFGPWAPFAAAGMMLALFVLLDSLARTDERGRLDLSPIVVCTAWGIFLYGLGADSLAAKSMYFVRGYAQTLLLFGVAAWIVLRFTPRQAWPSSADLKRTTTNP
jgi:hypothetical protein